MTRSMTRLAAILAGAAIAATLAMPVLAAGPQGGPNGNGPLNQGSTGTGIARCAADWITAKADPTVANLRAVGYCEIDRRLTTLERLRALVAEANVLTDAHQSALDSILNAATTGLTSLRAQIAADSTVDSLRTDIRKIYTDYRVYVLDARQVRLVRGDDLVGAAAGRLDDAGTRLAAAIVQAQSNGKDVTVAQGHLDAMTAAIAKARTEIAGDADAVLAQTPATWNAGTAKPVLDAARASLSAARSDLRTAVTEARAVLAALR
jgi:hypothetical protein